MKHIAVLLILIFSPSLFARVIDINDSNNAIFVSEGTTIISNSENPDSININNAKPTAVIFISDGTVIYNLQDINNVKIIKREKTAVKKKTLAKSNHSKDNKIAKNLHNEIVENPSILNYVPSKSEDIFFSSQIEKIIVSQNRTQYSSNAIISEIKISHQESLSKTTNQKLKYRNPIITLSYFSGKYSVRPPTIAFS